MINAHAEGVPPGDGPKRMRDGYLRGALSRPATRRQMDVLAAYVVAGRSVPDASELVSIRPSTVKVTSPTCVRGRASRPRSGQRLGLTTH